MDLVGRCVEDRRSAGVTGGRVLGPADLGRAVPIESENDDLKCLCDVLRRARVVLVLEGMMECSLALRAASTASKPLVSLGFLARCLDADEAAAMMFGEDMIGILCAVNGVVRAWCETV